MEPGPRQTVDRCIHPTLGPGIAVYDNGPAFFRADSGALVSYKAIQWAGTGGGQTTLTATPGHNKRPLTLVRTEAGETHARFWHPMLGGGWLVWERSDRGIRFEADDGAGVRFHWVRLSVGRAGVLDATQGKLPPEEEHWETFGLRNGEVLSFRRGDRPSDAIVAQALAFEAPEPPGEKDDDSDEEKQSDIDAGTVSAVETAISEWREDGDGTIGERVQRLVDAIHEIEALLDRYDPLPSSSGTTLQRLERLIRERRVA